MGVSSATERHPGRDAEPAPPRSALARWFFVDTTGPRSRRPVDVLIILAGALLVGLCARKAERQGTLEKAVADALAALPGWAHDAFAVAYAVGGLCALGAGAAVILGARHRRPLVRDLTIAVAAAVALVFAAAWLVEQAWPQFFVELFSTEPEREFPAARVAVVAAVLLTLRPYIVRPFRRFGDTVVIAEVIAAVGFGVGGPADVVGALGLGSLAAGAVLVTFGSPGGHPDLREVAGALADLGVPVRGLRFAARQPWGVRLLYAEHADGRPLLIKVYGRDACDAQFFARAWRQLIYRDAGPRLTGTRLQLVEHEALVTVLAQRAGVPGTDVVAAAVAGRDDAVLVLGRAPEPVPDGPDVPDPILVACWQAVALLHAAGIAHGHLTLNRFAPDGAGVLLTGFEHGSLAAPEPRRAGDVADLLTSQAGAVGVSRAVDAALAGLPPDGLVAALPYLQPAVLPSDLRRTRHVKDLVDKLRTDVADRTQAELPPPARVVRVRLRSLVVAALLVLAGYAMITALAQLNWAEVLDGWATANWWWVLLAFPIAQATVLSDAVSTMSAVTQRLPLVPLLVLQFAIKFVALAIPGPAGRLATTASFLHRFGVGPTQAVTQSALDTMAGVVVQVVVLILAMVFGDVSFDLSGAENADWAKIAWIIVGLVGLAVVAIVAIPLLRRWVGQTLRQAWAALSVVARSPSRAFLLLASNGVTQVLYAITLWCVVEAFHLSLPLSTLFVVIVAVGLLAGIVPIPGNIGVAEAALTAGLVWTGVPQSTAFAIAVTYRLCTYYLPPIFGVFAMRWLSARSYVG
jgi:uncharacterized membrane protein YbhN (UPF0104 family)